MIYTLFLNPWDNCLSAIMNSKFETNFPLQHQQKDLRLAIDMADNCDQPMYVVAAANEVPAPIKTKWCSSMYICCAGAFSFYFGLNRVKLYLPLPCQRWSNQSPNYKWLSYCVSH